MKKKNNLTIELDINSREDFFSKYNTKTLSPRVKEYLINELVGYDTSNKLILKIVTKEKLSNSEQEEYELALRKEFRETIIETKELEKRENIRKLILLIIGIVLTLIGSLFQNLEVVKQFLLVFGWFALGQVAYAVFFTDVYTKRKYRRLMQILTSKIDFD